MKYKSLWDDLTVKMGYWVDLDHPYITFDNKYIETVWYLLKQLFDKDLLYKGYTIQPYSPAAGTGLSTHELNQPGCYRDVKDQTVTAQFKVVRNEESEFLFKNVSGDLYFLAWTTTPWTLPSNTALAVGKKISYSKVESYNPYTGKKITVILATELLGSYFPAENANLEFDAYTLGDKKIPFRILREHQGEDLLGINYQQLIPFIKPMGEAFKVISGDFVTTEDGTGIVHIAPTFGADDDRVAKASGIVPLVLIDSEGERRPMVDLQGRFYRIEDLDVDFVASFVNAELYSDYAGRYVKNAYDTKLTDKDPSLDIDLVVMLKKENKAFKIEKHVHNYPHCWRTDKPVLYYPLDSWFVKTTAFKERMLELNQSINWKPKATGEGRFGNWLENLVDWNLSRSRFWGIPLPIWVTEDRKQIKCIGSAEELKLEIDKAIEAGVMDNNPLGDFVPGDMSQNNYESFDFHRPYVDKISLVSNDGQVMMREPDLIDVWFDSGSMPYAQFHYPFENKETLDQYFPADFIAEGVDQTRGWFFTLHAIATMVFDSVAYKTVVSNGLVLDKKGNKMSKRLGNAVDPFETLKQYGPDATRWYMITNAQPWDNLKFDSEGIAEVQRKFFGTLYNTYSFFALYANIDGFEYKEEEIPMEKRPELDRWILSELHSLIKLVKESFDAYEPTKAGRAIQNFVDEYLSNWFVRLSRRRFWKGDYTDDKISAYQTLYQTMEVLAHLISPIAPFYADQLYRDLNAVTGKNTAESVHLSDFPSYNEAFIDKDLEERMQLSQKYSSMVLSLRKKAKIRVRQPLNKVMIPVQSSHQQAQIEAVKELILAEVNVKEMEFVSEDTSILVKKVKPNFKALGPRYGKLMKQLSQVLTQLDQGQIAQYEKEALSLEIDGQHIELQDGDLEILTEDIPGWAVSTMGSLTVALDVTLSDELIQEGMAREFINRIQNMRKDKDFDVVDKIRICVEEHSKIKAVVHTYNAYICSETLATEIYFTVQCESSIPVEIDEDITLQVSIERLKD